MAGKFLDKTGLQHFWTKVTAKLGNYLPLTGGTVTGPTTIDGGDGRKIVVNGLVNGVKNAVSIQGQNSSIDLNVLGTLINGDTILGGGTIQRDKMPDSPGDNEIPSVGWVNTNYLPLTGGTVNGSVEIVDGDSGGRLSVTSTNASLKRGDSAIAVLGTATRIIGDTVMITGSQIVRSDISGTPTDREIATIGWVKSQEEGYSNELTNTMSVLPSASVKTSVLKEKGIFKVIESTATKDIAANANVIVWTSSYNYVAGQSAPATFVNFKNKIPIKVITDGNVAGEIKSIVYSTTSSPRTSSVTVTFPSAVTSGAKIYCVFMDA